MSQILFFFFKREARCQVLHNKRARGGTVRTVTHFQTIFALAAANAELSCLTSVWRESPNRRDLVQIHNKSARCA